MGRLRVTNPPIWCRLIATAVALALPLAAAHAEDQGSKAQKPNRAERIAKKAYIRASAYPNPVFDAAAATLKATPGWRVYDVPCGHDIMVDMPDRLTEILVEVA